MGKIGDLQSRIRALEAELGNVTASLEVDLEACSAQLMACSGEKAALEQQLADCLATSPEPAPDPTPVPEPEPVPLVADVRVRIGGGISWDSSAAAGDILGHLVFSKGATIEIEGGA